jgi:UDP-glucose 4-epimerase
MAILVTGGTGYIGSHMLLALQAAGEEAVVLSNRPFPRQVKMPQNIPVIIGDAGDETLVGDICKKHKVKDVIHFAAKIVVPESVADPLGYYLNNTSKARNLFEACVHNGVKNFVFSSTAAVYGNPQKNPVTEDSALAPVSPYGASKAMAERMLQDTSAAHDMNYISLRYFNVAGADPQGRSGQIGDNSTHLIKVAVETACGKRPSMQIFGADYPTKDGTCVRDYIHVSDLADFHLAALGHLRAGGGSDIFNCGYGRGFSVREVIAAVQKVSGMPFKVEIAPRRKGDPAEIVADIGKIKKALHVTPRFDNLETIVEHALAWEKKL